MVGSTLRARKLDRAHEDNPPPPVSLHYNQEHDLPPPVYTADRNAPPTAFESEQFEQEYGVDKSNINQDVHKQPKPRQFLGGMRSVWMTKHTEDTKNNRKLYVVTTIRELIIYVFFLVVICVIAFSMTSSSMYYFTKVVGDLFLASAPTDQKKFTEIQHIDDIWEYLQNQLLNALYWDETTMLTNYSDRSMIFYENRLLGFPRIRMLRVSNKSCDVVQSFRREIKECFGHYEESLEERLKDPNNNRTAFNYQPASVLQSDWVWGQIATYGGGGYVQDLSINNKVESAQLIKDLKDNRWVSRGTRVIFIDFSLYNANLNLFCIVQLIIELPATGGALTMSNLNTMKLLRYVNTHDYVILACEAIFCAFVIYYLIEEIIEIAKWRCSYLSSFWNILDLVVLATSISVIYLSLSRTLLIKDKVQSLLNGVNEYENMQRIVYAENRFTDSVAVLLFFAWIKIFKYVSFNKTMNQLSATLSRAAKDIGGFGIMFAIFFFAYVQFGYIAFGSQVAEYSTIYNACFTLLRTILGDFDFNSLQRANRVLGPIFFLTYIFLVFFVLLNMFLAIINDSYTEVKEEFSKQENELEVADFLKQGYYKTLRLFRRNRPNGTQEMLNYDAYKTEMLKKGYSMHEIDEQFVKYSEEVEQPLPEVQGQEPEPEVKKPLAITGGKDLNETVVLSRRMDNMENTVGSVADRLEGVIGDLHRIEEEKFGSHKKQLNMNYQTSLQKSESAHDPKDD